MLGWDCKEMRRTPKGSRAQSWCPTDPFSAVGLWGESKMHRGSRARTAAFNLLERTPVLGRARMRGPADCAKVVAGLSHNTSTQPTRDARMIANPHSRAPDVGAVRHHLMHRPTTTWAFPAQGPVSLCVNEALKRCHRHSGHRARIEPRAAGQI